MFLLFSLVPCEFLSSSFQDLEHPGATKAQSLLMKVLTVPSWHFNLPNFLACVETTLFQQSFWHIFWHYFWHIFWHSLWHIFWHSFWHSFWRSIWHIFWLTVEVRREHCHPELAVWGPEGNTAVRSKSLHISGIRGLGVLGVFRCKRGIPCLLIIDRH